MLRIAKESWRMAAADTDAHAYEQIGKTIIQVLDAAEDLKPNVLKAWIRIASLWLAEDIDGLVAEIYRIDELACQGKAIAPRAH